MAEGSLTGRLVVATTALTDPNFALTVVLVLEHAAQGALGVVLNRPSSVPSRQVVEPWAAAVTAPPVVFLGGPVNPDAIIAVGRRRGDPPLGWQPITDPVGVVDLDADPGVVVPDLTGLRLFAGYAGWSPGQLEGEIDEGAWFVVDTEPDDAFTAEPDGLWRAVLRRQGGVFTTIAPNPSLN